MNLNAFSFFVHRFRSGTYSRFNRNGVRYSYGSISDVRNSLTFAKLSEEVQQSVDDCVADMLKEFSIPGMDHRALGICGSISVYIYITASEDVVCIVFPVAWSTAPRSCRSPHDGCSTCYLQLLIINLSGQRVEISSLISIKLAWSAVLVFFSRFPETCVLCLCSRGCCMDASVNSTLISGQGVAASNSATSSRLVSLSAGLLQGWRTLVLCRPSGLKRAMTHGIPQKLKVHRGDRDHHEQKRSRSDVLVVDPGISTVSTGARIGLCLCEVFVAPREQPCSPFTVSVQSLIF